MAEERVLFEWEGGANAGRVVELPEGDGFLALYVVYKGSPPVFVSQPTLVRALLAALDEAKQRRKNIAETLAAERRVADKLYEEMGAKRAADLAALDEERAKVERLEATIDKAEGLVRAALGAAEDLESK